MAEEASLTPTEGEGGTSEATGEGANVVDAAPESGAPTWHEQLPESLRGDETLSQFSKIGELGEAYKSLSGKLENAIVPPGEDATEEEVAAYRKAIGIPDKPDEYELPEIKTGDGVEVKSDVEDWFRKAAYEAGLSQDQAVKFRELWAQQSTQTATATKEELQKQAVEAENTLRKEFGDRYDENIALAKRVVSSAGEDFQKKLNLSGLSSDPAMIRMVVHYARATGNDTMPGGGVGGAEPRPTDPRDPNAWQWNM